MSERATPLLALLAAASTLLLPAPGRADCKSPLPVAGLRALDERVDTDPAAVAAEAGRRLAALDPRDALSAAALQAIRADAYALMEDDVSVAAAVGAARAQLQRLGDGAARRQLEVRLQIVAADSLQTPAELAGGVAELARLEAALPVKSLDRACALIVRSRLFMRLGREEAAASNGIHGYQLAEAIGARPAVADAAYQLAFTYMRAGLWNEGLARAEEAAAYDRSTGRVARLANDLYVRALLLDKLGRYGEALAATDEVAAINTRLRQDIDVAFDDLLRCRLLISMQRLNEAEVTCRAASEVMTRAGRIDQQAVIEGELARVDLARGQAAAAVARLNGVLEPDAGRVPLKSLPRLYQLRADALARSGHFEAAWRDQQRVAELTGAVDADRQGIGAAEVKERLNVEQVRREKAAVELQLEHARQEVIDQARLRRLGLALEIVGGLLLLALTGLMWIRARHERARSQAAHRLEAQARVIETMREGVALLDGQGRIQYANPSLRRLVGRELDALVGAPLATLGIDGAGAGAGAGPVEYHVRSADGRSLTLLLTVSDVPASGEPLQVCILQDVTELRRLERQIHSATSAELGRLGSAVHEGIAQDLTGISLLLRTVAGSTPGDAEQLTKISGHVSRVIEHARTLARGLSPVQVAGGSLAAALSHRAQELAAKRAIDIRCRTALGTPDLGVVHSDQLYRIASEALQWVADAAGCARINLALQPADTDLWLEIHGDGSDAADEPLPDTIGYVARLLGGRIERAAAAPGGRAFRLAVPLKLLVETAAGAVGPRAATAASSARAAGRTSSAPQPS
ncbi:MAG: PAS domain-containing protein [Steroidobacteraceae bacterium]